MARLARAGTLVSESLEDILPSQDFVGMRWLPHLKELGVVVLASEMMLKALAIVAAKVPVAVIYQSRLEWVEKVAPR